MFFFLMIRRPPRSTRTDNTLSLHDALPISRDAPGRDCNAVIGKQLLRLVFVEIHVGSVRGKTGRPLAGPRAAVAAGLGRQRRGRARHSRRCGGRWTNRPTPTLLPPAAEGYALLFPSDPADTSPPPTPPP